MEQDIVYRIVAIACIGALYLLCAAGAARLVLAPRQNQGAGRRALLASGLFASSIVGCLLAEETSGLQAATVSAVGLTITAFVAYVLVIRFWNRQEDERSRTLAELRNAMDRLELDLAAARTPEALCAKAAKRFGLTRREEDTLLLLCEGRSYADIASALFLSPNTVKSHVRSLYRKMDVREREELKRSLDQTCD
ncbi:helix-turn-helix transcriptional regulator [Gordonibacter massiliensis (ex Traore et al. 2017)]|uniref:HTH luxR-type domain-containing protein n=1 Tax=Gordonibacter massiliensis (ex Traore et al. 2017) TaxID=1841863 RepID=A0A842JD28_9ACTN|nr:helix-turn-helix transcriptional regulator [Gordonibacter massiliensis (ex Traore et al. 2017)]MBC2889344.1 hypothetical protein [Gordonibacter massiliensis (ex Traore et al. 2017)]